VGAGKGAAAPETKAEPDPAEAEAQEFLTSMGPQGWAYYDRLFDGDGLPEGVDATAGRRYALAGLFREFAKFEHKKRGLDREALKAEVLAAVEKDYGERVKLAEEPALQQRELIESARTFYAFYTKPENTDDVTGETKFPEIEDKDAVAQITQIWANELGRRRTDEAIEAAIWRFRARSPEWAPAAREDADAGDDESPSTAAATTAGAGRKPRGAISGTSVPGAGLPPGKKPAAGEMPEDPEAEKERQLRKGWGIGVAPVARAS
jgi:hypothetical protein